MHDDRDRKTVFAPVVNHGCGELLSMQGSGKLKRTLEVHLLNADAVNRLDVPALSSQRRFPLLRQAFPPPLYPV